MPHHPTRFYGGFYIKNFYIMGKSLALFTTQGQHDVPQRGHFQGESPPVHGSLLQHLTGAGHFLPPIGLKTFPAQQKLALGPGGPARCF